MEKRNGNLNGLGLGNGIIKKNFVLESPFQPLLLGGVNVTCSSVNGIISSQTSIFSVLIHLVLSNKEWRSKGLTYFTSKQNRMMISNFFVVVAIILHRIDNVIMACKKL